MGGGFKTTMNYFVESVFQSHIKKKYYENEKRIPYYATRPFNSPSVTQLSRDSYAAEAWLRLTQGSKKEHRGLSRY